ncbi:unnamed protein product [Calypogeia fissa]
MTTTHSLIITSHCLKWYFGRVPTLNCQIIQTGPAELPVKCSLVCELARSIIDRRADFHFFQNLTTCVGNGKKGEYHLDHYAPDLQTMVVIAQRLSCRKGGQKLTRQATNATL